MNLNELTRNIEQWAKDRKLDTADPNKQMLKLGEEFGELCEGLVKSRYGQVEDSLGDMYVVMTILAMQLNYRGYDMSIESCVGYAYNEIKDRKGVIKDGMFVKEADL